MRKRKTIGVNPLDTVVPEAVKATEKPVKVAKEQITFQLPVNLLNKVRDAAFWTPGLTMARMAEESLHMAVQRLEKERGKPFPPRNGALKVGQPIKAK